MIFKFDYYKNEIELEVNKCERTWSKVSGLMFKKNSKPLLFIFNKKTKSPIHSFFCIPFIIIWLNEKNQTIESRLINSNKLSIKPKNEFIKILEIPENNPIFNKMNKENYLNKYILMNIK